MRTLQIKEENRRVVPFQCEFGEGGEEGWVGVSQTRRRDKYGREGWWEGSTEKDRHKYHLVKGKKNTFHRAGTVPYIFTQSLSGAESSESIISREQGGLWVEEGVLHQHSSKLTHPKD